MNAKAALAVALIAVTACGRDSTNARDVPVVQVRGPGQLEDDFMYNGFGEPARLVIRDQAAWQDAWLRLTLPHTQVPSMPQIDFQTEMVLLAAMGQRDHGGFSISLTNAAVTDDAFYISALETTPGGSCFTTQTTIEPVAVVRVPRFDGEVTFVESSLIANCYY